MSVHFVSKYISCWAVSQQYRHHGSQQSWIKGHYREKHWRRGWTGANKLTHLCRHIVVCREGHEDHMARNKEHICRHFQGRSRRSTSLCQHSQVRLVQGCMQVLRLPVRRYNSLDCLTYRSRDDNIEQCQWDIACHLQVRKLSSDVSLAATGDHNGYTLH